MSSKNTVQKHTMKATCDFHEYYPASYVCRDCGKSLCVYCQRNTTMPYQCPECMPAFWEKKVKRDRIMCLTPILIIIAVVVSFVAYGFYMDSTWEEDDWTDIYVDDSDIIPIVHTETYNQNDKNEVDITLKVYVTNSGTKKSGDVFIELYVMKNGTVRAEGKSATATVGKDKTVIFEIDTTVITGQWDLQLKIWEDGRVVQDGQKQVRISQGDIEDITTFDFAQAGGDEDMAKESAGYGLEASSLFITMAIIGLTILIIVGVIMYKARTKMPMQRQMPPMPPMPPQQPR